MSGAGWRPALAAAGLLAALAVAVALSLSLGAVSIDLGTAWQQWRAGAPRADAPELGILLDQRMPRTLTALLAGAGLALAGCAFQALLRNPLATPYTLGIASFGALGAWAATVLLPAGVAAQALLGFSPVQAGAFALALVDVGIIYAMAARGGRVSPAVLLLAGVTLGMIANAGILLMRYFAEPERLVRMDRWLMGGVDVIGYGDVVTLAVGVTPCAVILLAQAPRFDQLGFGEELAAGRGVSVKRVQAVTFLVGSLLTAVIVSVAGPIGFVGLIVPHAVRSFTGSRHRLLMPLSLLAGAAFLTLCDVVARRILPGETPIGIITSLLGGPFFLYLLLRKKFTGWE